MSRCTSRNKASQLSVEKALTSKLCEVIDTPRALAVHLMLKHGEYSQYLDLEINASNYDSYCDFAEDYLVTELLRKSPNLPLGIDTHAVAVSNFFEAEAQCKLTNDRLSPQRGIYLPPISGDYLWEGRLVESIRSLLGPLKPRLSRMQSRMRVGSGADIGLPGRGIIPPDKFNAEMSLTPSLIPFYKALIGDRWWEHQSDPKRVVSANEFFTVPKDARKDRGACKEPRLNLIFQLQVGELLRESLRAHGICLDSQPDVNRALASEAQDVGLVTIDLSQASDMLALNVVARFFPEDWAHLFELGRCEYTTLPNFGPIPLEKYSSMGNGFTFELETVLFTAIARTFVPETEWESIAVFGDDIIVPRKYAYEVIECLGLLGFKVNDSKTCLAGRFYESCGTDWFDGKNVRPFYLRGAKHHLPYELQLANRLRLWSSQLSGGNFCDKKFKTVWKWLESRLSHVWRKTASTPELGDLGLIRSEAEARPKLVKVDDNGSLRVPILVPTSVTTEDKSFGTNLSKLATVNESQTREILVRSRDVTGLTFRLGLERYSAFVPAPLTFGNVFNRRGMVRKKPHRGAVTLFEWPQGLDWI